MNQDELIEAKRRAVHALCVAQGRQLISVDLFELRHALVNEAPSPAAVDAIVADLGAAGPEPTPLPARLPRAGMTAAAPGQPLRLSATFSTTRRKGEWVVPAVLQLRALFGEIKLDMRDAEFASDTVEIEVDVMLGSIDLILPAGTQVENECAATFGDVKHKPNEVLESESNGLLVRLTGHAFLGDVKIRERLPSDMLPPERRRGVKGWLARVADSVD
jgi:hypothetical protein